jgi:hypothetical protein
MAKDPAFLFYPGDWQGGTATFSRFLKGCYMDVLIAQFNSGHLSLEEIKTVLGSDFGQSWPTLQKKFVADARGLFFNERLDTEMIRRREYSKSRSDNRKGKKDMNNISKTHEGTYVKHMENETGNETTTEDQILKEYEQWTELITDRNDQFFEDMLSKARIPESPAIEHWAVDHLGLLNRYPKMRPTTQDAFRRSCLKHIKENYTKPITSNGTPNKNQQHMQGIVAAIANEYGNQPEGK